MTGVGSAPHQLLSETEPLVSTVVVPQLSVELGAPVSEMSPQLKLVGSTVEPRVAP